MQQHQREWAQSQRQLVTLRLLRLNRVLFHWQQQRLGAAFDIWALVIDPRWRSVVRCVGQLWSAGGSCGLPLLPGQMSGQLSSERSGDSRKLQAGSRRNIGRGRRVGGVQGALRILASDPLFMFNIAFAGVHHRRMNRVGAELRRSVLRAEYSGKYRAANRAKLQAMAEQHSREMAGAVERYRRDAADFTKRHSREVAALEQKHKRAVEQHRIAMAALEQEQGELMAELAGEHSEAMAAMAEQHRWEVADQAEEHGEAMAELAGLMHAHHLRTNRITACLGKQRWRWGRASMGPLAFRFLW